MKPARSVPLANHLVQFMLAPRPFPTLMRHHLHAYLRANSVEIPTWLADLLPETREKIEAWEMCLALHSAFNEKS